MGARLEAGTAPNEVAGALLDACLAIDPRETRGIGCDNMTATVVVLKSLPKAATHITA